MAFATGRCFGLNRGSCVCFFPSAAEEQQGEKYRRSRGGQYPGEKGSASGGAEQQSTGGGGGEHQIAAIPLRLDRDGGAVLKQGSAHRSPKTVGAYPQRHGVRELRPVRDLVVIGGSAVYRLRPLCQLQPCIGRECSLGEKHSVRRRWVLPGRRRGPGCRRRAPPLCPPPAPRPGR